MSNRKPSEDLSQKPSMILEKQVKPKVANPSEDPRVSYLRQIYFSQQYLEKLLSKSYYIKWKGFDRADEPLGQACLLCENDLSRSPEQVEMELEVYDFSEVAVLACGHSFHLKCFELAVSLELMDPECFICGSMH